MVKMILDIDGMACGMCEAHINDTIRNHFDVKNVQSSFKKGKTEFLAEQELSEEELRQAIDPTGYTLTGVTVEPFEKKKRFGGRF